MIHKIDKKEALATGPLVTGAIGVTYGFYLQGLPLGLP